MRFVIDLDTLDLIASPNDRTRVEGKRGDDSPFEVVFVRSGVVEELAGPTVLTFGAKQSGKYDSAAVVLNSDFTLSGSGTTAKYLASPSFNTAELNALFLIDGDSSNDPGSVDLMAEFNWQVGAGPPTSCRTFAFRVNNDVLRDSETLPAAARPLWAPPLALTAPPENGISWEPSVLFASFSGSNNDLYFTQADPALAPTVQFSFYDVGGSPPTEGVFVTGSAILVRVHTSAGTSFFSAATIKGWLDASPAAAAIVVCGLSEGDGSGHLPFAGAFGPTALSGGVDPVDGTLATALGQLAIVTTTNDSGSFEDVWTCSNLSPMTWQPPGNIFRDRTTGLYQRQFWSGGAPDYELAYP